MPGETPFRAVTPNGRFVVEVAELVDVPGVGSCFLGRVILDGKYTLDELKTIDSEKIVDWARRQMIDVMRRSGSSNGHG